MAYGRISSKQQEILDYIKNEILNRGRYYKDGRL